MKLANYIAFSLSVGLAAACAPGPEGGTSVDAKEKPAARAVAEERPAPRPVLEVPEGTQLSVIMESALSSKTSQVGDRIEARLAQDLLVDGKVAARAGSAVRGSVTAAVPSGRVKTRARLAFAFDALVVAGGAEYAIQSRPIDITADDTHTRDAVTIGGGAGAGALVGAIVKGGKGAGIGALIGAGAGTGVVLIDKGKNVNIAAGATLAIELGRSVRIRQ